MWALLDIPLRGPRFNSSKVLISSSMESSADVMMDFSEVKVETSADDKDLEALLILEEGDEPSDVINSGERGRSVLRVRTADENTEGSSHDHNNIQVGKSESEAIEMIEESLERQVDDHMGCENDIENEEGLTEQNKMPEEKPNAQAEVKLRPKDRLSPHDAKPMVQRLSPDFPDALCELLFALQEGRRLNDQRCSFRLEHRRRCYSEPSTPRHSQRVVFSSMTSLQKEEFFDLLATSQGRRLDEQRAELLDAPPPVLTTVEIVNAPPPVLTAAKPRKSSCKVTEVTRKLPTQTPKEDLYNMIVNSQVRASGISESQTLGDMRMGHLTHGL
ncbi:hypothetical protein F2P79_015286 [Pimephales promelas]|nr:hypothetical protein F2P79_015286 [Pimephales promelas]